MTSKQAYMKNYREANKTRAKEIKQAWDISNKDYISEYRKIYNTTKRRPLTQEEKKESHLIHRYGITLKEYRELLVSQNYSCKICEKHETKNTYKKLYVDHCHKTGKVRGLLCLNCNAALGNFRDDPELIKKSLRYLGC